MKKMYSLILCLVFLSLACLGSGAVISMDAPISLGIISTLTNVPTAGAVWSVTVAATHVPLEHCAVVIADQSLHLRGAASESGIVLTWLKRGDELQLLSKSNPDWWRVRFGAYDGYARSVYLEESEVCDG